MSDIEDATTIRGHNPLLGIDLERLEQEMASYHNWLDERADEAYAIAESARSMGMDHRDFVEIPRAADLAGRTEKLLIEYLDGYEVADAYHQGRLARILRDGEYNYRTKQIILWRTHGMYKNSRRSKKAS